MTLTTIYKPICMPSVHCNQPTTHHTLIFVMSVQLAAVLMSAEFVFNLCILWAYSIYLFIPLKLIDTRGHVLWQMSFEDCGSVRWQPWPGNIPLISPFLIFHWPQKGIWISQKSLNWSVYFTFLLAYMQIEISEEWMGRNNLLYDNS